MRDSVIADLVAESAELDRLVAGLADADWRRATPAPGWIVAHQIAHLASGDLASLGSVAWARGPRHLALLLARPEYLTALGAHLPPTVRWVAAHRGRPGMADAGDLIDAFARARVPDRPAVLLARWRTTRDQLADALRVVPDSAKLPWFGPPMSPASMAGARMMETWAHGQDIADALGIARTPTVRLRHIAHLGVRARDYAFRAHGRTPPRAELRVELRGPDGALWTWGPAAAAQRVTGPALDFCLLVTQRRHPADLAVAATGPDAERWLTLAQAFAGPPGAGRAPGQFAHRS